MQLQAEAVTQSNKVELKNKATIHLRLSQKCLSKRCSCMNYDLSKVDEMVVLGQNLHNFDRGEARDLARLNPHLPPLSVGFAQDL